MIIEARTNKAQRRPEKLGVCLELHRRFHTGADGRIRCAKKIIDEQKGFIDPRLLPRRRRWHYEPGKGTIPAMANRAWIAAKSTVCQTSRHTRR